MKDTKDISTYLGHALAYVQSTIDSLLDRGFQKLDTYSSTQQEKQDKKHWIIPTLFVGVLWFVGNAWKSYYKKYNELRNRKKDKEE